jgi:lipopolysaccharide export system permease protein
VKIIHRYVLREHLGPLTFSLSALTFLLLINYIAKHFGDLVGKGLPPRVIAEFFLLSVPFTVAMTLPMSVLVATLYAFSRLAAENEITALKANGVSMIRLLIPVLVAASVLSIGMVAFNDAVLPKANHRLRTLQGDIARKKPTFALRPQILNEMPSQKFWIRANHIDQYSGLMREITIYDLNDPLRRRTIYADSGEMSLAANGSDLLLLLRRGYMLEVPKAQPAQLQHLTFDVDRIRVAGVANELSVTGEDSYKSDREMSICELQAEVARNQRELDQAQASLRAALQQAAHEALTGSASPPQVTTTPSTARATVPTTSHVSLGSVYCGTLERIRRLKFPRFALVRSANAAQTDVGRQMSGSGNAGPQDTTRKPVPAKQADTTRKADTTRRADTLQGARPRPDSVRAPAAPPQMRDSARLRLMDSLRANPDSTRNDAEILRADSVRRDSVRQDSVRQDSLRRATVAMANTPPAMGTPFLISTQLETSRITMTDSARHMDQYDVELHKKIAISVACIVFVLIGAPVALRFPRGGVGLVIGVSLVVFAMYYVGLIAGEALADRDILSPFWGMWTANIVLTAVGLALLVRMGRESATSRGGDLRELMEIVRGMGRSLWMRERRHEPGARSA